MMVNQKASKRGKLYPTMIYQYNFSAYNHMYNEELLTDIREGNSWLFGDCNAGTTSTNKKGHFGFIECWINKERIDNIFSIPKF